MKSSSPYIYIQSLAHFVPLPTLRYRRIPERDFEQDSVQHTLLLYLLAMSSNLSIKLYYYTNVMYSIQYYLLFYVTVVGLGMY